MRAHSDDALVISRDAFRRFVTAASKALPPTTCRFARTMRRRLLHEFDARAEFATSRALTLLYVMPGRRPSLKPRAYFSVSSEMSFMMSCHLYAGVSLSIAEGLFG